MTDATPQQEFAKALAEFQAELPSIGKDQTANAGQFSYSYADLTKITERAFPLLAKLGFAFFTAPDVRDNDFGLACELMHVGGHSKSGFYPIPKGTAQQTGSHITYARRYSLCAMTGISPGGEDDDGQQAGKAQPRVDPLKAARDRVWAAAQHLGWDSETLATDYASQHGGELITNATFKQLTEYAVRVEASTPDVVAS